MPFPVTGLFPYAPLAGNGNLVATQGGLLWTWDGATATSYSGAMIDQNDLVFMQQALDLIYGTDGINGIFKFNGTSLSQPVILAADGITPMTGVADLLYFFDRMWYAIGDFIYFSDTGNPESITNAPLLVRKGAGDSIIRLMSYRDAFLLVFKGGPSGIGSIHFFDVSTNDPTQFSGEPTPLFNNLSLVSPHSVVRLSSNSDADVLYNTREGLRSLNFTALDRFLGPSLPVTDNIPTVISQINYTRSSAIHANVFNDEILWWIPTGTNQTPDLCMGNSRKIPGNTPQQGWAQYDMMPATCSTVAAIGGDTIPNLYIGTALGQILQAFANPNGTHIYQCIGKRIDYGQWDKDKGPLKFIYDQDTGANGAVEIDLIFEDGEVRPLGTQQYAFAGFAIPFNIPFDIPPSGITENFEDIHFDANDVPMRRGKDFRVQEISNGFPNSLGYDLQCTIETYRYVPLTTDVPTPSVATPYAQAQLAATNYNG